MSTAVRRLGILATAPAVDRTHIVDALRPGTIHRPTTMSARPGGKGINAAHVVHALGGRVTVAAPLAGTTGRWLLDAAVANGVEIRPTWVPGELRTCISVFAAADHSLTEFYEPPAPMTEADWLRFCRDAVESLAGIELVAISGRLPPGIPLDGLRRTVVELRAAGSTVLVDSEGAGLLGALAGGADLVKINATEAAEVLDQVAGDIDEGARACAALLSRGAGSAVVTLGVLGAIAMDADGQAWHAVPPEVSGWFPVGSGDAFLAGLLVALAADETLDRALCLASGAAAANTEQPGAGVVDPNRVRSLAEAVTVDRI